MSNVEDRLLYLDGAGKPVSFEHLNETIIEIYDALSGAAQALERGRDKNADDDERVTMLLMTKLALEHSRALADSLIPSGLANRMEDLIAAAKVMKVGAA